MSFRRWRRFSLNNFYWCFFYWRLADYICLTFLYWNRLDAHILFGRCWRPFACHCWWLFYFFLFDYHNWWRSYLFDWRCLKFWWRWLRSGFRFWLLRLGSGLWSWRSLRLRGWCWDCEYYRCLGWLWWCCWCSWWLSADWWWLRQGLVVLPTELSSIDTLRFDVNIDFFNLYINVGSVFCNRLLKHFNLILELDDDNLLHYNLLCKLDFEDGVFLGILSNWDHHLVFVFDLLLEHHNLELKLHNECFFLHKRIFMALRHPPNVGHLRSNLKLNTFHLH